MSNLPTPRAQLTIKTQAPKDSLQFRDNQNHVLCWVDCTGAAHYVGDGTGVLPTPSAVKIFGFATVGSAPGPVLALLNSVGQVVGWLDQNGVPQGSLAGWKGRPTGFIDPTGTPQGTGPLGIGSL